MIDLKQFENCKEYIEQALWICSRPKDKAEMYSKALNIARENGFEQEAKELARKLADDNNEPYLWELPQPFEKQVKIPPFPLESLPDTLRDYIKAVSEFVQVFPEMAVLPLLSVLSLCVQGKAVIKHPANSHTEPLNLYTITIAAPGERKSGCFRALMKPVNDFVQRYNAVHAAEIRENRTERAYLEYQREKAIKGKNADLEKAKELDREISQLGMLHDLRLNVSDATPEALAWEMHLQGGKIGVIDDEGGIFNIISGLYSGSAASNLDIFLKAYDGSAYTIIRRTSDDILLESPLLSVGLMTQPEHFTEAMNNKQFSGRGFIQRFLFAFPESKAGERKFISEDIPESIQRRYDELITKLLQIKQTSEPLIIQCDNEAANVFNDYYLNIESAVKEGGIYENIKEWCSKQFGRCLRIAGVLHLCEHSASEPITAREARNAVFISMWCENNALRAFSCEIGDSPTVKGAKYILDKLKKSGKAQITKRELRRICRRFQLAEELDEPLELLEDLHYIEVEEIHSDKGGKSAENITVNSLVFKTCH